MNAHSSRPPTTPIGEILRARRVDVLHKGLREMARLLGIAPAHLTDIEKGRRSPSNDLLVRMVAQYDIDEGELRAAWTKAEPVVGQVATQDAAFARKVPVLLRTARNLSPEQLDKLIKQAEKLSSDKPKRQRK